MEVLKIEKVVLHVSEVACLLQCSSLTVYKLIHSGKLPAYKSGKGKYGYPTWKRIYALLSLITARIDYYRFIAI